MRERAPAVGRRVRAYLLASGVAHDFNNILAVIMGTAEKALLRTDSAHPLAADFGEIQRAARRAVVLTRQLLAFSRKSIERPEILDLNFVSEEIETLLVRPLGTKIEVRLDLARPLPFIRVDRGHVEQMLVNLAVNARDAMPDGGDLILATTVVPSAGGAPVVRLTVSDTARAWDEATRNRIFEPFFTTKARGKGTGLGLSMVFGMVQQAGGTIAVTSSPGRGATFVIEFPIAPPAAAQHAEADTTGSRLPAERETILLVDDEDALRQIAAEILRSHGHRVVAAHDAEQALALLGQRSEVIDLLVTAVVLPGMNGPTLARRVAEDHGIRRALFVSGFADASSFEDSGIAVPDHVLVKPHSRRELLQEVRSALDAS